MKKTIQAQFKELEKIILSIPEDNIINFRVKFNSVDGLEILSARKEDNHYLNHIGNSTDSPLGRIYSDKFIETFGRLSKGKKRND